MSSRPVARSDVVVRNTPADHVILDPVTQQVHTLNATAMAIWVACDGDTTVEEIAEAVADLAGLTREEAIAIAVATVDLLSRNQLLETADTDSQ